MTITIDIAPELESQLMHEAEKVGLDAKRYILRTLEERLRQAQDSTAPTPDVETDLLRHINLGLSQATWRRYHELVAKRRAEKLTPEEQTALVAISDQIEEANARRMAYLVELARLRKTSLGAVMADLGIKPATYA